MAVLDTNGVQQFYYPDVLNYDPDQLRQQLINTGVGSGDYLIAVQQSLVNAVIRTQHDKNSDNISSDDFINAQDAFLSGRDLSITSDIDSTSILNISTVVNADGKNIFGNDALFSFNLLSGARINGGKWQSSYGIAFNAISSPDDVDILNAEIITSATSKATGININTSGIRNWNIHDDKITTIGYGILSNSSADISGMIITNNFISSEQADSIALNDPEHLGQGGMSIVGNIIETGDSGTNSSSGFSFSAAATYGAAIIGNVSLSSRNEAFHFEDNQHTNVLVGNIGLNCNTHGIAMGQFSGENGESLLVVENSLRARTGSVSYGIYSVWDNNGSISGMSFLGNKTYGFLYGLSNGVEDALVDGNIFSNCLGAALYVDGGGGVHGTNFSSNNLTLAKTLKSSLIGKIVSDIQPNILLDTSAHAINSMGSILRGFSYPLLDITIQADILTQVPLFVLPKRIRGNIIIRTFTNDGFVFLACDILYDESNVYVSNQISDNTLNVIIDFPSPFIASGGNCCLQIISVGEQRTGTIKIDFDGLFYN